MGWSNSGNFPNGITFGQGQGGDAPFSLQAGSNGTVINFTDVNGNIPLEVGDGGYISYRPGTYGEGFSLLNTIQGAYVTFDSTTGVTYTYAQAMPSSLSGWQTNPQITQRYNSGTMYFVGAHGSNTSMTGYCSTTATVTGWMNALFTRNS